VTARRELSLDDYITGIRAGDRVVLARAITLVESLKPAHQALAQDLLQAILPDTGKTIRVGLTGVPGVGKSTLIDQLGSNLTALGRSVAILAVDPSSSRTGGSILGDKTRMQRLANDPRAFIRPSPTAGHLGGVAGRTREAMMLVEAAGFDVVIVETVGVGQSETAVAGMVDTFVALMLPGGGDELQGIKKGLLELADIIAVNKADGDNLARARRSAAELNAALGILTPDLPGWQPPVLLVSGREDRGLDELWRAIEGHGQALTANGALQTRRQQQAVAWLYELVNQKLLSSITGHARLGRRAAALEEDVRAGRLTAVRAADEICAMIGAGGEHE
jgi:LAO/AO transport system kinase